MIENLTNILRLAYFSETDPNKPRPKLQINKIKHRYANSKFNHQIHTQLQQLSSLIKSQEPFEKWYIQFQIHKDQYYIKKTVYDSIMQKTITIHNLFLMLIQFKVFDSHVWIPIDRLCALKGGRENQLCCLIHYAVTNLQGSYQQNSVQLESKWSRQKAIRQMGYYFQQYFNSPAISLSQKVAILPMLMILNLKNSFILWERLSWLHDFPHDVIFSLQNNLTYLLQRQGVQNLQPDDFTEKLYKVIIEIQKVQGFISPQNLFIAAYELYSISHILQFLKDHIPQNQNAKQEYKILVKNFVIELFECFREFHYDITKTRKDFLNLTQLIILNQLYIEELSDKSFLNNYVENILCCYSPKKVSHKCKRKSFVSRVQYTFSRNHHNEQLLLLDNKNTRDDQPPYKHLITQQPEHIITSILNQLYQLRPEYLQTLYFVLKNCHKIVHSNLQELWSECGTWFYRLQLYLLDKYLLQFLIENSMALQTNLLVFSNSECGMFYYYDIISFMLKGNPIAYGHLDHMLLELRETEYKDNKKNSEKQGLLAKFFQSFLDNIITSRNAIMHIISDQLQWKQNVEQEYPNANYQSYFVAELFRNQTEWLINVIKYICLIKIQGQSEKPQYYLTKNSEKQPCLSELHIEQIDYYKWVTFFLMLYYYFYEVEHEQQRKKLSKMDQILLKQKFLQQLFGACLYQKHSPQNYSKIKILDILQNKLDDWQYFYNRHPKSTIIEYGLSYPITKMVKNKLKAKIKGFIRRKQFEEENQL